MVSEIFASLRSRTLSEFLPPCNAWLCDLRLALCCWRFLVVLFHRVIPGLGSSPNHWTGFSPLGPFPAPSHSGKKTSG